MCSINIAIGDPQRVEEMNRKTKHRGNISKIKIIENVGFGGVRLRVQSLSDRFDTPYETNKYVILFNAEIYNFKELKPSAECDIELIAEDYDITTFDCDMAYAKFDKAKEELEIVTDRFGKRQLFYKIDGNYISGISSEIKGLVTEEDKLNINYLAFIGRFGFYFKGDETLVENIRKFEPGKKYIINTNTGKIISMENIAWDSNKLIPDNYPKDFKSLMELSVKRRLISDIPISMLLSGLDSSIVLYHIKKLSNSPKIFTIKNGEDIEYVKRLASEWNLDVNYLDFDEVNNNEVYLASQIGCDLGSNIPNYNLFKKIKEEGYNITISGDIMDELFGYPRNIDFDFQNIDINLELKDYHFIRLDKLSMRHTLELRHPASADYIIDFAMKLPYEKRINKIFLKEEYRGLIPDFIIDRIKQPLKLERIDKNSKEERIKLIQLWRDKLFNIFKNGNTN